VAADPVFFKSLRLPFIISNNSNWCNGEGAVNLKAVDKRQGSINFNI